MSPDSAAVSKYGPKLHFPKPTPGLSEIEPRWVRVVGLGGCWVGAGWALGG